MRFEYVLFFFAALLAFAVNRTPHPESHRLDSNVACEVRAITDHVRGHGSGHRVRDLERLLHGSGHRSAQLIG